MLLLKFDGAIATIVGRNCDRLPFVEKTVNMWVYEEMVEGPDGTQQKLTEVINTRHENVKYLPGIQLPPNVVACADLAEACADATLLIFVLPHQFLPKLLPVMEAIGMFGVSNPAVAQCVNV